MRRAFLFIALAFLAVLAVFTGCTPSETHDEAATASAPVEPAIPEVPSVNIVNQLLVYREVPSDDGKRHFERDSSLAIGEAVTRVGDTFSGVTPYGDQTLVQVRNSLGNEGYVSERYLVPNAKLAAVTDSDAVVYSRPNLVSPTENVIERGSLVALFDEDAGEDFVRVTAYNSESRTPYFGVYLKKGDVSTSDTDVQAGLLLYVAMRTDGDVARRELLENAEGLGNSAFVDDVRRELAVLRGESPQEAMPADLVGLAIEPFAFTGVVNTDGTPVYRYPQAKPEYDETTLDSGAIVDVKERTVDAFTVDGKTASWFRVATPSGWVFGAFIDPQ